MIRTKTEPVMATWMRASAIKGETATDRDRKRASDSESETASVVNREMGGSTSEMVASRRH